ncbi:MAG: response regulator [Candidatus Omnitrophota bacterium]|nr:response regulator [Candidatus Omnitrophota bacterium]
MEKNILIADDDKDLIGIIKKFLTGKGHRVDFAYDGDRALDMIKSNHYDIIFVDFNMPGLTGLELAKYVKTNKLDTKTVFLTGYPAISAPIAKYSGADEYLEKSASMDSLLDSIVEIIDRESGKA